MIAYKAKKNKKGVLGCEFKIHFERCGGGEGETERDRQTDRQNKGNDRFVGIKMVAAAVVFAFT